MTASGPSDDERADAVSVEEAAARLDLPSEYLAQLLEARTISSELIDGEPRISVSELASYRERRAGAQSALRTIHAPK